MIGPLPKPSEAEQELAYQVDWLDGQRRQMMQWCGRLDAVFLVSSDPTHPGWPLVVHRAHTREELGIQEDVGRVLGELARVFGLDAAHLVAAQIRQARQNVGIVAVSCHSHAP